jgi:hypothetical protein
MICILEFISSTSTVGGFTWDWQCGATKKVIYHISPTRLQFPKFLNPHCSDYNKPCDTPDKNLTPLKSPQSYRYHNISHSLPRLQRVLVGSTLVLSHSQYANYGRCQAGHGTLEPKVTQLAQDHAASDSVIDMGMSRCDNFQSIIICCSDMRLQGAENY